MNFWSYLVAERTVHHKSDFILVMFYVHYLRNSVLLQRLYTAKIKCRKFETNIPRKEIPGTQSQFPHSCVCERIIFPRWVCLFCWRKYVDRSCEYINRSQTLECINWGWGRAIPRKRIYKRNCRCSVNDRRKSSLPVFLAQRPFAHFFDGFLEESTLLQGLLKMKLSSGKLQF